jgi:hypothetical protein
MSPYLQCIATAEMEIIMPIEKRPTNNLPPNYVPPGGTPYKVKTNDDWGSVAKAHGITENELVYFNFGTVHPTEVNWYLRQNVGCTRPIHDQKNWMFTSDASPGIIYLPPKQGWKRPVFPQTVPSPDSPQLAPSRSGIWYVLGGQEGGIPRNRWSGDDPSLDVFSGVIQ